MSLAHYLKNQPDHVNVIKRYQGCLPVNVAAIADDLGVALWEDDLPEGISGKIFRDQENGGSTGFSIVVAKTEPLVRKRFTAAHEIAHFLLHRTLIEDGIEDNALFRSRLCDRVEHDANRLAAEILMPVSLMQDLLGAGIMNSAAIARRLQVSEAALKNRMGVPT